MSHPTASRQVFMNSTFKTWVAAGAGLSLALLAGRLLGLGRELIIANQYGASRTADQLILLLTFPDVMTNLLAAGAMSFVLVPAFSRFSPEQQRQLFWQASCLILCALGVLAVIVTVIAPSLFFGVFAPGLSEASASTLEPYLPIFGLMVPLTGITSVTASWLHSRNNFVVPAMGTSLINGAIISALIYSGSVSAPYAAVGFAVITAAALRYGIQLYALRPALAVPAAPEQLVTRSLLKRYVMAVLAGGVFALFPMVARAFASHIEGGIATFNYGFKLAELPLALAITVIPVLLLPKIAKSLDQNNGDAARQLSRNTLYSTVAIAIAIGLPAAWYAPTIVEIIFGWLGLEKETIAHIAVVAGIAFLALPAFGAVSHCMSVLNGANQQIVPMVVSIAALILFALLSALVYTGFGLSGIMLGYLASYFLAWLGLAIWGARSLGWPIRDLGLSKSIAVLTTLNVALGVAMGAVALYLPSNAAFDIFWGGVWFALSLLLAKHLHFLTDSNL